MRMKRPHVATLDEVTIRRNGDEAIIEYADQRLGTTHFRLGPQVQQMTDGTSSIAGTRRTRHGAWREFGRLLTTHAGWGRRIVFVPDDELG